VNNFGSTRLNPPQGHPITLSQVFYLPADSWCKVFVKAKGNGGQKVKISVSKIFHSQYLFSQDQTPNLHLPSFLKLLWSIYQGLKGTFHEETKKSASSAKDS
jgi:hypothetical protein